jgi:site-specific DNA-cytosine methylase
MGSSEPLSVVGLFAGIGGFEEGFRRAGHQTVAATDVVKVSTSQVPNKGQRQGQATMAPVVNPATTAEAKFLRLVQQRACGIFSTVLGPEANDVHRTHLHLDLQDRNSVNVCK